MANEETKNNVNQEGQPVQDGQGQPVQQPEAPKQEVKAHYAKVPEWAWKTGKIFRKYVLPVVATGLAVFVGYKIGDRKTAKNSEAYKAKISELTDQLNRPAIEQKPDLPASNIFDMTDSVVENVTE